MYPSFILPYYCNYRYKPQSEDILMKALEVYLDIVKTVNNLLYENYSVELLMHKLYSC